MEQAAVEKDVGKWLPNAQAMSEGGGDETEPERNVVVSEFVSQNYANQGLREENAGANQYQEFYAWRNETAPVKGYAPSAVRGPHICSLRRSGKSVKGPIPY
jgi:hypothetical protein